MPESLHAILAKHRFLDGLSDEYVELMLGCASNVRFEPGETLFHEGDMADTLYLVREGRVALELTVPGRDPVTLQTCGDGDVIGWSWMVAPHRWRYGGRAVARTRAIALDGACLRKKADENHELGYQLLRRVTEVLAHRLEATRLQLLDLYADQV